MPLPPFWQRHPPSHGLSDVTRIEGDTFTTSSDLSSTIWQELVGQTLTNVTPAPTVPERRTYMWPQSLEEYQEFKNSSRRFEITTYDMILEATKYNDLVYRRQLKQVERRRVFMRYSRAKWLFKRLASTTWQVRRDSNTCADLYSMFHGYKSTRLGADSPNFYSADSCLPLFETFVAKLHKMGAVDTFSACSHCFTPMPAVNNPGPNGTPYANANIAVMPSGGIGYICYVCARNTNFWLPDSEQEYPAFPDILIHVNRAPRAQIHNYSYDVLADKEPLAMSNEAAPFFLGVELEVAFQRRGEGVSADFNRAAGKLLQQLDHCIFKSDSSISGGHEDRWLGFEIVSTPMTLKVHQKLWKEAFVGPYMRQFHSPRTCGMHVHMDRSVIDKMTLSKLLLFYNRPQMHNLLHSVAGRSILPGVAHYSVARADRKATDIWNSFDRYSTLNLEKGATAEVRIFASTVDYATFMMRIEFCHASVMFCQDHGLADVTNPSKFIAWLWKHTNDYPFLTQYAKRNKDSWL